MMEDVDQEVNTLTSQRIQDQQSHSNYVLATVDMQNLSCGIVFIQTSPSVLDSIFLHELTKLCGIHQNITKLVYMSVKMT